MVWVDITCEQKFQERVAPCNQVHRARLLTVKDPQSGAWLRAASIWRSRLHLDDSTVRVSVELRAGAVICVPHSCRYGHQVDRLGRRGLSCRYSAGHLPRHVNVNDMMKRCVAAAGIPFWLEPKTSDRGDIRRPAVLFCSHSGRADELTHSVHAL